MTSFSKSFKRPSYNHHFLLIQLYFLLISSITQFPLASKGSCHEHERRALLDFKSSLEDPSNRLKSWHDGSSQCCGWHGIECSTNSFHVVAINIRNTDLEQHYLENLPGMPPNTALHGKLSPSLSNISHLEFLDLGFNNFQESLIPLHFSHLPKLVHLDLSYSNLSASISTQFTNLTSLQYLDLSCTGFLDYSTSCLALSSMKWVSDLVNLQVLKLRGIDLSSQKMLGQYISYLFHLRHLDLSSCSLSSSVFPIHFEFHNLSRLSSLRMSGNHDLNFQIPVELVNLTSLSMLDLSDCELHGSVPYLPQLRKLDVNTNLDLNPDLTSMFQNQWPKLETLSISFTNIRGSIPNSISHNAPLLVRLSAHLCSIQGSLPSSIYNLSQLQYLELSDNNITGYVHSSVSNLKFLSILDLSLNNFQGSIPTFICEVLTLQQLDPSSNNITGTIPSCISKLQHLTVFRVSQNSIQGTVPLITFIDELNLTSPDMSSNKLTVIIDQDFHLYTKFKLENLALGLCNLKGLIPSFICKMTNLMHLDMSNNHLTGVVPSCISKLKNIITFNMSNNKLHGPLPPPPQGPNGFMSSFDLSNNKLSGEISIEAGKRLFSSIFINLASNQLSGSIPISICSKDSTSIPPIIDLSNNKLSGVIPTSIGYCSYLSSLNLGYNNLSGNVPNELEKVKSLRFLQLHDNNFDGTPLNFISTLQSLEVLNLANNNFTGSIPSALGSLGGLNILSLRSNNFTGSIPENILNLDLLQVLDLSQNNLTGHIPKILGKYWRGSTSNSEDFSDGGYSIQLQMVINGITIQLEKFYNYSSGIDLSSNMLVGNIPVEIGLLKELAMLNLSHNHLSGSIPASIGNMSGLGSLDLSYNRLNGHIPPQSLTTIDFLGFLHLSYNELSGMIPRGNHFDTLSVDGWAFIGNTLLCGLPTKKVCEGVNEIEEVDQDDASERLVFYGVILRGLGVGFWGLFFVLFLKKRQLVVYLLEIY